MLRQAAGDEVWVYVAVFYYLRYMQQMVGVRVQPPRSAQWEVGQTHDIECPSNKRRTTLCPCLRKLAGSFMRVSSDTAAACLAVLHLSHAFWTAFVLAHAHAYVCPITMYHIIFAPFSGEWACLGIRREPDELLRRF